MTESAMLGIIISGLVLISLQAWTIRSLLALLKEALADLREAYQLPENIPQ
jgi:hypothetical protein